MSYDDRAGLRTRRRAARVPNSRESCGAACWYLGSSSAGRRAMPIVRSERAGMLFGRPGQANDERRSHAFLAVYLDAASMLSDDISGSCQPQAGAGDRSRHVAGPPVALEDLWDVLRRNTYPVIFDREDTPVSVAGDPNRDLTAGRAVLDRIRQ